MKTGLISIAILSAATALSGCMQVPETTDQMRGVASSHFLGKVQTVKVNRSINAVNASLAAGARKCLNRTVSSQHWSPGMYGGGTYSTVTTRFSTEYRASSSAGELAMSSEYLNQPAFLKQKGGVTYVIDAKAANGGTVLTIHGGKWGMKEFNAGVVNWAQGGQILCPPMPGHAT